MSQIFLSDTNELEKLLDGKRAFLVHTASFEKLYIKEIFRKRDALEFTELTPNPDLEQVKAAVKAYKSSGCDMIAAVGGGSSIDVAKCIKLFVNMDEADYLDKERWRTSDTPLLAVPTTAGSGSESTRHAVVYKEGVKQSISFAGILPDYVFLDGKLLAGLPDHQKRATMLDALCQAIESCWSKRANEQSMDYSEQCIDLIRDNWRAYLEGDAEAGDRMLLASNYAGRAIDITTTTAAHAMSYGLTSSYKLPHGHAVGLCMLSVWKNIKDRLASGMEKDLPSGLEERLKRIDKHMTFNDFADLMKDTGMINSGIVPEDGDLDRLVSGVNPERLGNHPLILSADMIRDMYSEILTQ